MWMRRLLLSIALLGLFTGGGSQKIFSPDHAPNPYPVDYSDGTSTPEDRPKCNYFLASPVVLTSGSKSLICTTLERCDEPVSLIATLEYYGERVTIAQVDNVTEYYGCKNITVPKASKAELALLRIFITGPHTNQQSQKQVIIDNKLIACSSQKNRRVYRQGDDIYIRILCYDGDLKPVNRNFTTIIFWDPKGNQVGIYEAPKMEHGVLTWNGSFSPKAQFGGYRLEAIDDMGDITYIYIQCEEFVLPKWDWTSTCPGPISILDETAVLSGNAQYGYGKPLPGTVIGKCCRMMPRYGNQGTCYRGIDDLCIMFDKQLDENGSFNYTMDLKAFKLHFSGPEKSINCEMTVKEKGTEELRTRYCYMWITGALANIDINYNIMGRYYNRVALNFHATLTTEKGDPIPNKNITIQINGRYVKNALTNENGIATCPLDMSKYTVPNITITASYRDPDLCYTDEYSSYPFPYTEFILERLFSHSGSSLRVVGSQEEIPVHSRTSAQVYYQLTKAGVGKGRTNVTFLCLLIGKNTLVKCDRMVIDVTRGYKGSFHIKFDIDERCATGAKIMVVALLEMEHISHSIDLNVGVGFKNKMRLEFAKAVVAPQDTVDQIIIAAPGSYCGLVGQNSAYNLISSYDDFNAYSIIQSVITPIWGYQYKGFDLNEPAPPCVDPNKIIFCDDGYFKPSSSSKDGESYEDLVESNILGYTNLKNRRKTVCGEPEPTPILYSKVAFAADSARAPAAGGGSGTIVTYRSELDNVFGYLTAIVGDDGTARVSTKMPGTIASWESTGFCFSPEMGIGMPPEPAKTITLLYFHVSTEFPQHMYKSESIYLVVTASNHMKYCIQAKVKIETREDDGIEVTPADDKGEQCVCHEEVVYWTYKVSCNKIGYQKVNVSAESVKISETCDGPNDDSQPQLKDILGLTIHVEVSGVPRESTSGHLITVKNSTASVTVSVPKPPNMEPDTFEISIAVIGDVVGLTGQNMQKLLVLPSGCCEQLFSLIITIGHMANYLQHKGELDNATRMAVGAKLQKEYGDHLGCLDASGAVSLYRRIPIFSTMMSLYALEANKVFLDWTFADEKIPGRILSNMASRQNVATGCIQFEGTSLYRDDNNFLIRGNAQVVSTLYTFLKIESIAATLYEGAKNCIKDVKFEEMDQYTQVCLLMAYITDGQQDKWDSCYPIVKQKLTTEGDLTYLEDIMPLPGVSEYFRGCSSSEIMGTAMLLLAMTMLSSPSSEDQDTMAAMTKTLSAQANSYGGFSSTQATAYAMRAITAYSQKYGTPKTNVEVVVTRDQTEVARFIIADNEKFKVFKQELEPKPGNITIGVKGEGAILAQVSVKYHMTVYKGDNPPFELNVTATTQECNDVVAPDVKVHVTLRYIGPNSQCGMTVMQIRPFTGHSMYIPPEEINQDSICEMEDDGNMYNLYFNRVTRDPIEFYFTMNRKDRVATMQPALITVTSFATGESTSVPYNHPCYNRGVSEEQPEP